MLDGLDDIGWSGLSHAYGSAEDTPGLLRQAASEDGEVVSEAISDLHGSIFHQGTVYPATVAAVPFLAELARCAPQRRDELVWMLGMLADPQHAYGMEFPAVREAVAGQGPVLVALLDDDDAQVREAAAYAGAQACVCAELLWRRRGVETDEAVRASLALALGATDADTAGAALADAVLHGQPAVRVAAAVALLRAGLAWPDGAVATVVDAIDEGAEVTYCWARGADWSEELLVAPTAQVAVEVLGHMLRAGNPETRRAGIWAMSVRCDRQRSAPALFVPMVAPALDDPDTRVRSGAMDALRRAGAVAGRFADVLADVAARFPDVAGEQGFTTEYRAVETLLRLGDPRWIEPVCTAACAGHRPAYLLRGARFSLAVLAEVRGRLATDPARADVLAGVVGQWGTEAAAAVPELVAAMSHAGPQVAVALLDLEHDDPAAVPYLRARVEQPGDLRAAMAIRRMTGDLTPMLDALHAVLTHKQQVPQRAPSLDMSSVSELGDALAPLLTVAREHLTGVAAATYPQREAQILAARVVAATTGPQAVVPTVRAVLKAGHTPARAAADLIADLARVDPSAVAGLETPLRGRLDDRWNRLAAARALARLGVPTAELAEPLVRGVTDYAGRFGIAIIMELRAVETVSALEELVASEERFRIPLAADDIVWADEMLQERARSAIAALRGMRREP